MHVIEDNLVKTSLKVFGHKSDVFLSSLSADRHFKIVLFHWLLPLGVATEDQLPPSHPGPTILLCHTVLLHYIHHLPLFLLPAAPSSSSLSNASTLLPLHMSEPAQPRLSNLEPSL